MPEGKLEGVEASAVDSMAAAVQGLFGGLPFKLRHRSLRRLCDEGLALKERPGVFDLAGGTIVYQEGDQIPLKTPDILLLVDESRRPNLLSEEAVARAVDVVRARAVIVLSWAGGNPDFTRPGGLASKVAFFDRGAPQPFSVEFKSRLLARQDDVINLLAKLHNRPK